MKDAVLRELAAIAFSGGERAEAAGELVGELSKRDLKKFAFYLKAEIKSKRVTVRAAAAPDEDIKKTISGVFEGGDIRYEIEQELGAGLELEHGDNIERINVKNIIERAIQELRENL